MALQGTLSLRSTFPRYLNPQKFTIVRRRRYWRLYRGERCLGLFLKHHEAVAEMDFLIARQRGGASQR